VSDNRAVVAIRTRLRSELRARWRAWAWIALLIGLVGGVVLASAAGARRTSSAFGRYLRSSRAADLLVSPENSGAGYYAALTKDPAVAALAPVAGVELFTSGPQSKHVLTQMAMDRRLGTEVDRPKIVEGRAPNPGRAAEALADSKAARLLHLHAGSELHATAAPQGPEGPDLARARQVTLRIVGVVVTRDDVVAVNALASVPTLYATPAFLHLLDPSYYAFDDASVRIRPGMSRTAFAARARSLVSRFPEAGGSLYVADQHQQAAKVESAIRPQAVALALFSLLAGIAALFVVGQIISRQLFLSAGENVTLRALGMGRNQIFALGLAQVGVPVVGGAVLAGLIAVAASPLMPIGPARVAEPNPGVAFDWALLAIGAAGIVVAFLVRVAWPAWRLAGGRASAEGTGEPSGAGRPSRLAEWSTRAGAPVSACVGVRLAVETGRGRTAVPVRSALTGTVLAVGAVAAAFTFGTNLERLVDTPRLYGQTWDVVVDTQFGKVTPAQVERVLQRYPGVAGWTFGNHNDLVIAGHDVPAIGLLPGRATMWPTVLEGRTPQGPDEIILGTKTLENLHRRVGDEVQAVPQGESATRPVHIVGRAVFPFFGRGAFSPTGLGEGAAWQDAGTDGTGFNFFTVRFRPGFGHAAEVRRLHREVQADICPGDQVCGFSTAQRPADITNYARIRATPLVLAAVLGLLAVATVTHLLVTSTRRRRRDLAVLKTLGFVRRQVSAAVAWQATLVVGLALLLGIPLGVAAGRSVWVVFAAHLGIAKDTSLALVPLLLAVPLALAIANALAAGPGVVAGRLRPAVVLRAE